MINVHKTPSGATAVGRMWDDVATTTENTVAVVNTLLVIDQNDGPGLTITLPAASSAPAGTPVGFAIDNPAFFTVNTVTAADGSDDTIVTSAAGTVTTLSLGFNTMDFAAVLVTNGVDAWVRMDQATNTTATAVSTTTDMYLAAANTAYLRSFGLLGVVVDAFGGPVVLNAATWVVLAGAGVIPPARTTAEISAFVEPPAWLQVVNTTTGELWMNFGTPSTPVWRKFETSPV